MRPSRAGARVAVGSERGRGHGGNEARPVPQRGQRGAVETGGVGVDARRELPGAITRRSGRSPRGRTRCRRASARRCSLARPTRPTPRGRRRGAGRSRRTRARGPRRAPRRCGSRGAGAGPGASLKDVREAQRRRRSEQRADAGMLDVARRRGSPTDARQSSSSSWVNVWYGPQQTPCSSSALRTSSSVRASNHGFINAAIASRAR